jgi:hypothetical protein
MRGSIKHVLGVGAIGCLLLVPLGAQGADAAAPAASGAHPELTPYARAKPATTPMAFQSTGSPWTALKNAPPFIPGTMLLASDGTVLVHEEPPSGGTANWWKLTPNSMGSYVDGTWTKLASMPGGYDPLYFASAILPDGRLLVEGGEYLGGTPTWTNKGAIYNPVTNTWRSVAPPAGWTNIGDAQSNVLANGTFMLAQACQDCLSATGLLSGNYALFNATGLNWLAQPPSGKNDPNDEEAWTLLHNNHLLTVDTWLTPTTETFDPQILEWSNAGNTPKSPVNSPAAEIGPQAELPNGDVFVVGAGTGPEAPAACTVKSPAHTALYDSGTGAWKAGPSIPTVAGVQNDSADGPAATLPDGNVLFDVSPCVFNTPLSFDLYNAATNSISSVPDIPNADNDSTFYTRMLVLPNGQVLFNDGSHHMLVYTAGGTANPSWAPVITGFSAFVPGKSTSLSGIQMAGLDQGAVYGDDVQSATNFPIVRITNRATGQVTYARTSHWSNVSLAPGAASTVDAAVPAGTPAGPSTVVVIANGIASQPVAVDVGRR